MMKYFIGSLFLLLFTHCKMLKMFSEQEFSDVSNEMQLSLRGNKLMTNLIVQDSVYKFVFDTGASKTVISDTSIFKNYYQFEKAKFGKIELANKRGSYDRIAFASKNEIYTSESEIAIVIVAEKNQCIQTESFGVFGMNYFTRNKKILQVDFESLKAKVLSEVEKDNILIDYTESKSEFYLNGRHINLMLSVNGVEESFLLDTGNSAAPLIIGPNSKISLNNGIEYNGSILVGADRKISNDKNIYYNNAEVMMNGSAMKSLVVYNSAYLQRSNNVGLPFLKNFNWIIDYKDQKVYFKQIKNDFTSEVKLPYVYKVNNNAGKLNVTIKLNTAKEYNLGDQITEVNNIPVTTENICEMQSLLNKTIDWTTLNLTVLPGQTN